MVRQITGEHAAVRTDRRSVGDIQTARGENGAKRYPIDFLTGERADWRVAGGRLQGRPTLVMSPPYTVSAVSGRVRFQTIPRGSWKGCMRSSVVLRHPVYIRTAWVVSWVADLSYAKDIDVNRNRISADANTQNWDQHKRSNCYSQNRFHNIKHFK